MTCTAQPDCDAAVQRLGAIAAGALVVDLEDFSAGARSPEDVAGQLQDLLAREAKAAAEAPLVIVLLNLDKVGGARDDLVVRASVAGAV